MSDDSVSVIGLSGRIRDLASGEMDLTGFLLADTCSRLLFMLGDLLNEEESFGKGLPEPLLGCERVTAALLSGVLAGDCFVLGLTIVR